MSSSASSYWEPLRPVEDRAFEQLAKLAERHRRDGEAFSWDFELREALVGTMVVVEDARARVAFAAESNDCANFNTIPPTPWARYERAISLVYDEIRSIILNGEPFFTVFEPDRFVDLRKQLGEARQPFEEQRHRQIRDLWRAVARALNPRFSEYAFRMKLVRQPAETSPPPAPSANRETDVAATPVAPHRVEFTVPATTSSAPHGQTLAPERSRETEASAPPQPDLRTFTPTNGGPQVTLDATKHILATEIEAKHNVPLSTLARWVNREQFPTLGKIGQTRVFDLSAFLIRKNNWNPRRRNNMRIDAHRRDGA